MYLFVRIIDNDYQRSLLIVTKLFIYEILYDLCVYEKSEKNIVFAILQTQ